MASAEVEIAFYNFTNPHLETDISVEIEDKIDKFCLEKIQDCFRPVYQLEIKNLEDFGVDITSENISNRKQVNDVIQNLITAINLTTLNGAATRHISRFEKPEIEYTDEEIEEIGKQTYLETRRDSCRQPVSEQAVYELFQKINRLEREHEIGSNTRHILSSSTSKSPNDLDKFLADREIPEKVEVNLLKSLNAFDAAMNAFDKSIQHLLLFISMETAINIEKELKNDELKEAVSEISDIDKDYIEQWRKLYKRQKHSDNDFGFGQSDQESMKDLKKLSMAGITNRGLNLVGMRKAAASAIQDRLNEYL